jgi:hypothetical protein
MENLETLVTIITAQNKTIEVLKTDVKTKEESAMFWYKKFKELEESLTPCQDALSILDKLNEIELLISKIK